MISSRHLSCRFLAQPRQSSIDLLLPDFFHQNRQIIVYFLSQKQTHLLLKVLILPKPLARNVLLQQVTIPVRGCNFKPPRLVVRVARHQKSKNWRILAKTVTGRVAASADTQLLDMNHSYPSQML